MLGKNSPCQTSPLQLRHRYRVEAQCLSVEGVSLVKSALWYQEVDVRNASDHDVLLIDVLDSKYGDKMLS